MSIDLKNIFQNTFVNEVQERHKKQSLNAQQEREISLDKKEKLEPFIQFLQMFVDAGVYVKHRDFYSAYKNGDCSEPVKFQFYLGDSSFKWHPGISIFIENPSIEIAIPNRQDEGVVVIFLSSRHPDRFIIDQNFTSMEKALKALGSFISKCTVKIDTPYAIAPKTPATLEDDKFFNNIPSNPKVGKSIAKQNIEQLFGNEDKEK